VIPLVSKQSCRHFWLPRSCFLAVEVSVATSWQARSLLVVFKEVAFVVVWLCTREVLCDVVRNIFLEGRTNFNGQTFYAIK